MSNKYYIYFHFIPGRVQPFYVGLGVRKRAWRKDNRNEFWNNIVSKYGYEIKIMHSNLSLEQAQQLEIYYIQLFGKRDDKTGCLVNLKNGGSNGEHAESTKNKIRARHLGKKLSEDHIEKIRKNASKYWAGRRLPQDSIDKISNKNRGRQMGKDNPFAKAVIQFSKKGEFIAEFDCILDAAKANNCYSGNISSACQGKLKTAYGYIWKYKSILILK